MKFNKTTTNRGFCLIQFEDDYGEICDFQESSSLESHIWLGIHVAKPRIMASKVQPGGTGWVDYEIPEDVFINTRMHLNRKQSVLLAMKLIKFGLFNKI